MIEVKKDSNKIIKNLIEIERKNVWKVKAKIIVSAVALINNSEINCQNQIKSLQQCFGALLFGTELLSETRDTPSGNFNCTYTGCPRKNFL